MAKYGTVKLTDHDTVEFRFDKDFLILERGAVGEGGTATSNLLDDPLDAQRYHDAVDGMLTILLNLWQARVDLATDAAADAIFEGFEYLTNEYYG